jgi:drug/metabolite transporter (DMT)-like permease
MQSSKSESDLLRRTPPAAEAIKARVFLVLLCLGWGITWPMMKIALDEIPPFSMRVASLTLGVVTLTSLSLLQGRSLQIPSLRTLVHLCVASFFNIVAFSVFTPFAQMSAATSRVAIVVYTMPIWATLMARPILGERLTTARTLGLALCIAGMTVLIYPLAALGVPTGILLAIGAAVSWAAGTIYLKWARIDSDPMAAAVWQLIIGVIAIGAMLPMIEDSLHLGQAHRSAILALIFAGIIGSGISYFLWFDIVRRLPATIASLGVLSSPVIGVVSSMLLLGERPTLTDIVGFSLIFTASATVLLRPQELARRVPEEG